jgi:hypothetical protein
MAEEREQQPELDPAVEAERERLQISLFDVDPDWKEHWHGMPDFVQRDLRPKQTIQLHFKCDADREAFSRLIGQTITDATKFVWYPKAEIGRYADKRFKTPTPVRPRYPIYVVSKGRWEKRLTSDSLDEMGIPHYVVVERSQFRDYEERVRPLAKVICLDPQYQIDYDAFDDLGMTKSKGPGPARNFAWEHSIRAGHAWHWVMDDNINGFYRLFNNLKTPCKTGAIFRAMEDFCARYENVGMAGPNYFMFASRKEPNIKPFTLNTRIYSCNLIRNDVPLRWRGRYNEDTDLSLRMLLAGVATVQFNAFLQLKMTTQTLGGGNTEEFYAKEGTRPKSQMLVDMHPNLASMVWKFDRWHHTVDYTRFSSLKLKFRRGVEVKPGPNDYGMELEVDPAPPAAVEEAA